MKMKNMLHTLSLCALLLLGAFTSSVWGGQAHVYVYSSPQAGGYVDVKDNNTAPSSYSVTQDHQQIGGAFDSGKKTFYLFYSAKPGYHFCNWYKTSEDNYNNATTVTNSSDLTSQGQSVQQTATGIGAQNSYYAAVFAANSYTISFDGNDNTSGSMSDQSGFVYGTSTALNANAFGRAYVVTFDAKGGTCGTSSATATYTFDGWKSADNTSYSNEANISTFSPTPAHEATVTLTAQWISASVTLPNATKSGAVLDGWYNGDVDVPGNKVGVAGDSYTPTANVTLTAKWINKYTPVFTVKDTVMMVDGVQENAFSFEHVPSPYATYKVESISEVQNGSYSGKVVEYDGATNTMYARNAGVVKVVIKQDLTDEVFAGKSDTVIYRVYKYGSNVTGVSDLAANVDANVSSSYSWTYTKPNANAIGAANHVAGTPVFGESATSFYYTLDHDVRTSVTSGSDVPNSVIAYVPSTKTATGKNKGVCTVHLYQPETYKYTATDRSFNVTISKIATSFSGSAYNLMVDGTQTADYNYTNTSAAQPTDDSDDDFYYAVEDVSFANSLKNSGANLVTFNPENKLITACNAGTGKITLCQKETYKYTGATVSYNVAVYKYENTFSASNITVDVEESKASDYVWKYTKPDAGYVGDDNLASGTPGEGSESGDFYYVLTQNVTTDVTTGSADVSKSIAYYAGTKTVTGKNEGTGVVTFYQKETYKYEAANHSFDVTINKRTNTFSNRVDGVNNVWEVDRNLDDTIPFTFSTTNTRVGAPGRTITQIAGIDTAAYDAASNSIRTNFRRGTAQWRLNQAEDYQYNAAEATMTVNIDTAHCDGCYVATDLNTEHSMYWLSTDYYDFTWTEKNAADSLIFQAERWWQDADASIGITRKFGESSSFESSDFKVVGKSQGLTNSYTTFRYCLNDSSVTGVHFYGKGAATGDKRVQNLYITRKKYLYLKNAADGDVIDTLTMPDKAQSGSPTAATFYVNYSTCANMIRMTSTNPHVTFDNGTQFKEIATNVNHSGNVAVALAYSHNEPEEIIDTITVYSEYEYKQFIVKAKTVGKYSTRIDYVGPASISVDTCNIVASNLFHVVKVSDGSTVADAVIKLSTADRSIIDTLKAVGCDSINPICAGSTNITASYAGDGTYAAATNKVQTITINKIPDEISIRGVSTMMIGDEIDYSTWASSASGSDVTLESDNESVFKLEDGKIKAIGRGTAHLIGSADGDDCTYSAGSAKMSIKVRDINDPCETLLLDSAQKILLNSYRESQTYPIEDGPKDSLMFKIWKPEAITSTRKVILEVQNSSHEQLFRREFTVSELPKGEPDDVNYKISLDTMPTAKYIFFDGRGTIRKYVSEVKVTQKAYLTPSTHSVTMSSVKINRTATGQFTVNYSDLAPIQLNHTNPDFMYEVWDGETKLDDFDNDCGDYGTYTLKFSYVPRVNAAYKDSVFIFASGKRDTIVLSGTPTTPVVYTFTNEDGNDWNTSDNWDEEEVPDDASIAIIAGNVVVDKEYSVYSLTINEGATVTIMPNGGLTVGAGGISGATTGNFVLKADNDPESATVGQTGYLRISPNYTGDMPNAKVENFCRAYYDRTQSGDNAASWQCVGAPITSDGSTKMKDFFTLSWVYSWDEEHDKWVNNRSSLLVTPFKGVHTTQFKNSNGMLVEYTGRLNAVRKPDTISLTYHGEELGYNLLANSYTAPIDISQFHSDDFINAQKLIYILNAGTKAQSDSPGEGYDAPGKFIGVPIKTASELAAEGYPTIIPSMQGFWIKASGSGAKMVLDYSRLVWGVDYSGVKANTALRVAKRTHDDGEAPITGKMKLSLRAGGWNDFIFMLESEKYDAAYEDGYDAYKIPSGGMDLFTIEGEDQLGVDATNSIIGTHVGVRTGSETAYTLHFSHLNGRDDLALLDSETEQTYDIYEGMEYTFFAEPNSEITERFMIVEREDAPSVTTGVDNTQSDVKASKFIKDGQLFILKNGVLYDATGTRVK